MGTLKGKKIVVLGASRGVGRTIVRRASADGAHVLAVARGQESLDELAKAASGVETLSLDAATEDAPSRVFAKMRPDVLVVSGGALPSTSPIHELTWQQFEANWQTDVKMSFLFCREALRMPLQAGSTVILISSGAALGGSPISGGYAGSKRTQMFIANYGQKESDRLGLGLRFIALLPARIMPQTELGRRAVDGYARYLGISASDFIQGMSSPQSPEDVANTVAELAGNPAAHQGNLFTISGDGIASAA
jgi:NAD(P)-dependent dehydrogenase (short-subunit alcohol dehydrogenase family)